MFFIIDFLISLIVLLKELEEGSIFGLLQSFFGLFLKNSFPVQSVMIHLGD
jgi:hypothetical protein